MTSAKTPPREVIFVIDNSGSMAGPAIAQAKASLAFAPGRLEPQDGTVARFLVTAARVVPWDASGIDPGAPGRQAGMA